MTNVQRVCAQCGEGNAVESRYCARCGYDTQSALPAPRASLPAVIGQAALPVLIGAAGLVMRAGWKLLQNRLAQATVNPIRSVSQPGVSQPNVPQPLVPQSRTEVTPSRNAKRTIRIRSAWAINNGNGVWQQGTSDQTIEFDD